MEVAVIRAVHECLDLGAHVGEVDRRRQDEAVGGVDLLEDLLGVVLHGTAAPCAAVLMAAARLDEVLKERQRLAADATPLQIRRNRCDGSVSVAAGPRAADHRHDRRRRRRCRRAGILNRSRSVLLVVRHDSPPSSAC
jgi:hypothetical protein